MADALDYSDIFTRLNILIKYFYLLELFQTNESADYALALKYLETEIDAAFSTSDEQREIRTLSTAADASTTAINALKSAIVTWCQNVLQTVGKTLNVANLTDYTNIIEMMAAAMIKDAEYVFGNNMLIDTDDTTSADNLTGAIDAVTTPRANAGSGALLFSLYQPGFYSDPTVASRYLSQISIAEIMTIICTNAAIPGSEIFTVAGAPAISAASHLTRGSGTGPSLTAGGNSISNNQFETWAGTPLSLTGWTAKTGTFATDIVRNSAGTPYIGTYCMELIDGGVANTRVVSPVLALQANSL